MASSQEGNQRALLKEALSRAESSDQRGRACAISLVLARQAQVEGEVNEALGLYRAAVAHGEAAEEVRGALDAHLGCASLLSAVEASSELIGHLRAVAESPALGELPSEVAAGALAGLGQALLESGELEGAVEAFSSSLSLSVAADAEGLRSRCLIGRGEAQVELGCLEEALASLTEGLEVEGSGWLSAEERLDVMEVAAHLCVESGDASRAADLWREVLEGREEGGDQVGALRVLGRLIVEAPRRERGALLARYAATSAALEDDEGELWAQVERARLALGSGDDEGAAEPLERAVELASVLGRADLERSLRSRLGEGALEAAGPVDSLQRGALAEAREHFAAAGREDAVALCDRLEFLATLAAGDHEGAAGYDLGSFEASAAERLRAADARLRAGDTRGALELARALVREGAFEDDPTLTEALEMLVTLEG